MISVLPPVLGLPPIVILNNLNWYQVVAVLPFYVGLAAAPGYLYVWAGRADKGAHSPQLRSWLMVSLWAALIASAAGTIISVPAVIPIPFAAGSVVCSLVVLVRFRRFLRQAAGSAV
jgi:hypothetical protein